MGCLLRHADRLSPLLIPRVNNLEVIVSERQNPGGAIDLDP